MYIVPQHAQIHYRCAMDVAGDRSMKLIREIIWVWLKNKVKRDISKNALDYLYDKNGKAGWFFCGRYEEDDRFKLINHGEKVSWFQIRTVLVGENEAPALWGMELVHPDSKTKGFYWITSVSLEYNKESDTVRFVSFVRNYMRDFYLGPEPESMQPSAPGFISTILKREDLSCSCEGLEINKEVQSYLGNYPDTVIRKLYKDLTDSQRRLPYIVMVQEDSEDLKTKKLRSNLEKWVRGNANVYVLSPRAYEELQYYRGQFHKSENFPAPNLENDECFILCSIPGYDSLFQKTYYEINDKIVSEIICSVSRYSKGAPRDLISFQSVLTRRRFLQHLQLSQENAELKKEGVLYESSNKSLADKNKELEDEKKGLEDETDRLESQVNTLTSRNRYLESKLTEQRVKSESLEGVNDKLTQLLGSFVDDLEKQLRLCGEMYNDRVYICEEAYKSARDYSKENKQDADFYKKSWQMLQELVTTLYDCCFDSTQQGFIEQQFNAGRKSSGITFTMNEGRQTNRDNKMRRDREIVYKGKTVSIAPHLKYGNDDKSLRLHLYIDNNGRKLVVGYWGTHKKTASSKKSGKRA